MRARRARGGAGEVGKATAVAVAFAILGVVLPASAQGPDKGPPRGVAGKAIATPGAAEAGPTSEARLASLMAVKGGLTADQVAERAALTSPDARDHLAGREAAEASARQGALALLPRIDIRARYTRLSAITQKPLVPPQEGTIIVSANPDEGSVKDNDPLFRQTPANPTLPVILNNVAFDATLTIPLSDYALRLVKVLDLGTRSVRAAELEERAARVLAASSARLAYYEWARGRAQVVVAEQGLEQAKGHLADAQAGFNAGVVGRADALRAESQARRAELGLSEARHGVRMAEARVRILLRDSSGAPLEVGENVLGPPPELPLESVNDLQQEAERRRLELRALDEAAGAHRVRASLQRVAMLPRLDGVAGATVANPNPRYIPAQRVFAATWEAGVVVSWSPTEIPAARAGAAADEARAAQLAARREAVLDAVRLEVQSAWQDLDGARDAVRLAAQTLTAAQESYRIRRELYRGGRASYIELADAETDLTRARLDDVSARIDARVASARLNHAVGRDVNDGATASRGGT